MDIIFETSGSTASLKQWLQAFKEIDESLLLEIDLEDDVFVTKTFTTDRTIVKYGKIGFEQCNLNVINILDENGNSLSVSEWIANHKGRVYVGLLRNLGQFIKNIDYLSKVDVYKIIIRFKEVDGRYQAYCVDCKTIAWKNMRTDCYNLSEFNLNMLDDNVFFNRVAVIPNPISFEIKSEASKSFITGSDVYSNDPKKDIISFEVNKDDAGIALHVKDHNKHHYEYCISNNMVDGNRDVTNSVSPVTRANYIIGTKGDVSETSIITISSETVQNGRMKIETTDKMFTTIIANVRV